ncbi:MMPL family transporter [Flavobacteriaceae bacterium R38]|nr:MMPL family transporter [Flavobacteriaceae bacterium R38]
MKKVISYFIKYPVAVNVVILAFIIFGIVGMLSLKSSFFPLVDSRIITINVTYPGASPQEIEEGIVLKIEDNLKGLIGVDRVTSTSRENSGTITVEIEKGKNIDVLLAEVKNAVDRVPSFPTGMEPLVVAKQENVRQTISFAANGEGISLASLKQITRQIENDLRAIDGISQIEITGYPNEEIEIAVREDDLLAYNLTFQDVAQAVSQANILTTGGNIKTEAEEYLIRANNRSYYGDELSNLIVRADNSGRIVRLKEVAEIRDRFSETPNATYFNGNLSVNTTVTSTNSEDLISAAEKVKEYVEDFNARHNNIHLDVTSDLSITLTQRTALLVKNAWQGVLLVLIFLSLFLNTRLAFWVAFGLPIAFLGMFIFAAEFDVTINVLSLFGMIIVIGILVDDGIVIAENIYQHYEKGKNPIRAAIDGTMEVIPPIVSAIITTVLAFSTFLFLDSRIGEFFGEVSTVVILTLIVSLIEALIILPSHLAHSKALKRESKEEKANKKGIAKIFQSLRQINEVGDRIMIYLRDKLYSPVLRFVLNQKFISFSILAALLILTIGSIGGGIVRTTIFPSIASDRVSINLTMPQGTNEKTTDSIIATIEESIWEVNDEYTAKQSGNRQVVENVIRRIGPGSSIASLIVNLLPGEFRDFSSPEITGAIREKVGPVYGVESLTFGSGGNFGGSPVSVSLLGNNIRELKAAKTEFKERLAENPLLKDITDNDPAGIKEIKIKLKENAYLLGLNLQNVMGQVRSGFFGFQAQRFQRGQDEIRVWVRYDRENRSSINDLDEIRILMPNGERVPFSEIADYEIERGEVAINHLEGLREIQVSADLKDPNESATDILANIRTEIMPEIQSRYPTIQPLYEGQNREAGKLSRSASKVAPIILFLIYATIAFTFRSFSQPLFLLLMIPFSLIGVAWGHYLHGFPINVLSYLGIIALIGIMVNDGLVLVGKFNSFLKEGLKFDKALYEAGRSRFRAIFLTSVTTIAGLAPLLLEKSRQAQFLKPMAISIAYGIGIATILTLLMLPLLLSFSNNMKVGMKWLWTGRKIEKEEVERAIKELNAESDGLH